MPFCSCCTKSTSDLVTKNIRKHDLLFCGKECYKKLKIIIEDNIKQITIFNRGHVCVCKEKYYIARHNGSFISYLKVNDLKKYNCKYFAEAFAIHLYNMKIISNYCIMNHLDYDVWGSEIGTNIAVTGVSRLNRRSDKMEEDILSLKSEITEIKLMLRDFMTLLSNLNK
jgi:hypothetical protein